MFCSDSTGDACCERSELIDGHPALFGREQQAFSILLKRHRKLRESRSSIQTSAEHHEGLGQFLAERKVGLLGPGRSPPLGKRTENAASLFLLLEFQAAEDLKFLFQEQKE